MCILPCVLQLRDHGDLPRTASVHVTVCSRMRAKLVSEVKENINKLKRVPEESIAVLASVCRTVSLATLHMVFPAPRYWRQSGSGGMPEYATAYVEDFLGEFSVGAQAYQRISALRPRGCENLSLW